MHTFYVLICAHTSSGTTAAGEHRGARPFRRERGPLCGAWGVASRVRSCVCGSATALKLQARNASETVAPAERWCHHPTVIEGSQFEFQPIQGAAHDVSLCSLDESPSRENVDPATRTRITVRGTRAEAAGPSTSGDENEMPSVEGGKCLCGTVQ